MPRTPNELPGPDRLARPFHLAAFSSRLIGMAALTLGAIILYLGKKDAQLSGRDTFLFYLIFALIFLVPGALYLVLATFVSRRRRWAVLASFALAMFDMTLLGVVFVTSWGSPGRAVLCPLAGLFVVALAVMTAYLGRSLESLKRAGSP
jgi:peptidoglycan/LPS O-acetylase OafA/YrhL